jgi:hypothetical protein
MHVYVRVVLCSWANSNHKLLSKYSAWYNAHGFHTVALTVAMNEISFKGSHKPHTRGFWRLAEMVELMRVLNAAIERHNKALSDAKKEGDAAAPAIVIHLLSNGGLSRWTNLLRVMHDPQHKEAAERLKPHLKGMVWDSAPASASSTTFSRAWTAGIQSTPMRLAAQYLIFLLFGLYSTLLHLFYWVPAPCSFRSQLQPTNVHLTLCLAWFTGAWFVCGQVSCLRLRASDGLGRVARCRPYFPAILVAAPCYLQQNWYGFRRLSLRFAVIFRLMFGVSLDR